jgi:16S rRNA (uracil1498-N3)-methyltransferase
VARLYLDERLAGAAVGDRVSLTGDEARHAVRVSRVRIGERIAIGNGAGLVATGTVEEAGERLSITVASVAETARRAPLVRLVQALAKGGRDELSVQAATELGVDGVMAWSARRSVVTWSADRAARGRRRWHTIVREAAKQSLRPWLPEVGGPVDLAGLAELAATTRMLVLEPTARLPLSREAARLAAPDPVARQRDVVLVVGPEGGISPDELDALAAAGAVLVRLGDTVLRTSTAGPAALAVLNSALGRW